MAQAAKPADSAQKDANDTSTSQPQTAAGEEMIASWAVIQECIAQCGNLSPDDVEYVIPCTAAQQELAKAGHDLGAWIFQSVFEVAPNSLDRAKRTFGIIRDRTPTFRTRIMQPDSGYYQVVTRDAIEWKEYHGSVAACKRKELAQRFW